MLALPVFAPKHPAFVWEVTLVASAAAGCVIVTAVVVEQPLASVMMQIHVPAGRPMALDDVWTGVVFQLYV